MLGAPVRRRVWRGGLGGVALAMALDLALVLSLAVAPVLAQETGAVFSVRAAPVIAAGAGSKAPLPIALGSAAAIPKGSFVTVRGLPPAVELQDGHAVGPGWWAVPLSACASLVAQVPDGVTGRSEIVISLIALDGRLLAQSRSALVIQPSSPPGTASLPPLTPKSGVTAPAPELPAALTEESRARAERLLARGEAYLANGNIMGARDFFERAADAGLAAAALRLAATYDPAVLKRLKTQGVAPDAALARKWYARARDLGSADATGALARLRE